MISFVLPVYNCYSELGASLGDFVASLRGYVASRGETYEVIIVDDGSREGEAIGRLALENGCRYLRNEQNRGKGYTVRRGMQSAQGDVVIFMDGDFPFFPEVPLRMVKAFERAETDIVIGDRTLDESVYPKDIAEMRKAGSRVLSFFVGNFFTRGIFDTQCGIKGFRRRASEQIFPVMTVDGFAFDLEVLYIALKRGFVITRMPVGTRKQAASNVRVFRHGLETVGNLVRIRFNGLMGRYR